MNKFINFNKESGLEKKKDKNYFQNYTYFYSR